MASTLLIAAGKFAHRQMTLAAIVLVVLCLSPLQSLAASASSEPADIAALRASQARSATELRQQAIKLRSTVKDRRHRAWSALALAEFENDLENADAALTMLDEAQREAEALKLADLKFSSLNARSTILVNRGRSGETEAVLKEMKGMIDASASENKDPGWRAQWLNQRGVLERKLGNFDTSLDFFQQSLAIYRKLKTAISDITQIGKRS